MNDTDSTRAGAPGPELSAAARALTDAAAALTRALGDSFHEVKTHIKPVIAAGLREAADGLTQASGSVRASAARAAADRRAEKAAQTRFELLQAAATVIAARGYEGASMGDIAAQAGYTKGALYAHFDSKEELFAVLAEQQISADQPIPAEGQLAGSIRAGIAANPDPASILLFLEFMAYAIRNPGFGARVAPAFEAAVGRGAAQSAANRGQGEPTREDRETAIGLLALVSAGPLLARILDPGAGTLDEDGAAALTGRLVARLLAP